MKGRFGLTTTLVLVVVALIITVTDNTNYAQYTDRWRAVELAAFDTFIAFAALMSIRSFFLVLTARTRMSGWMSAIASLAFAMAVMYYPFTIGAVIAGLAAFGVAWKSESKLPPWRWLPETLSTTSHKDGDLRFCKNCGMYTPPADRMLTELCGACGNMY